MQRLIYLVMIIALAGCGSTPYRDDYTKHVNLVGNQFDELTSVTFAFYGGDNIDLRGHYKDDDEVEQSAILYQGGAGLVGLLVQIGAHASLVDSNRNDKLALAQQEANTQIQALIDQVQDLSLSILVNDNNENLVSEDVLSSETLRLRPIFFSSPDMSQLMLKLVAWIPHPKGGKNKAIYQNMVEVYADKLDEEKRQKLLVNQDDTLALSLAALLNKAVYIALNDVIGVYRKSDKRHKSFFIEQGDKKKVIRGSIVEETCDYQVVQDLHSWFIAIPVESKNPSASCNI